MAKALSHRNALIVRLLALVADLSRRDGCDLYELAARHRVTVRTIRRDLDALAEAGVPLLDEEDGRRKRWRIEGADARAEVAALVDASQVLAIHAALRGVAGASPGTHAVLGDLADKLARALGPADRQRFAALAACFDDRERATFDAVGSDVLLPVIGRSWIAGAARLRTARPPAAHRRTWCFRSSSSRATAWPTCSSITVAATP